MRIVDSGAASSCQFVSLVHSCKLYVPEYVLLDVCAQPVSARDRLEAATGRICTRYHVKSPRACDPSASTPPECSVLAADQYAVVMACICDELGARHVTRRPWQELRATRVIVRTPLPVSYGCADRDWPAIGVYHT